MAAGSSRSAGTAPRPRYVRSRFGLGSAEQLSPRVRDSLRISRTEVGFSGLRTEVSFSYDEACMRAWFCRDAATRLSGFSSGDGRINLAGRQDRRACRGTQVAADAIERRVLAWLQRPTGDLSPEAQFVLTRFAPLWDVLIPQVEHAHVNQLVWEVRWGGRKDEFAVMLDEIAIAEEHARIKRRDEEPATGLRLRRSGSGLDSMQ